MAQGPMLILILLLTIIFIVIATSKFKLHPFLSLIVAAYGLAFAAGIPSEKIAEIITSGFGGTLTSIGIVIISGTIIGTILEKSGAAVKMAEIILKVVGEKRPEIAMSIIGYIVSIPVFCDSGFIILSSLNKSLSKKTKKSLVGMSIALSTGLYATHTLVPPTPGPIAAAANLKLDNILMVIVIGMIIAIPAVIVGNVFAIKYASKFAAVDSDEENVKSYEEEVAKYGKLPSAWASFAPIIVPILLMAFGSIAKFPTAPFGNGKLMKLLTFLGTPVNALLVGVIFAFFLLPKLNEETLSGWIGQGLKDAAIIMIITAAGGSLGSVIKATNVGTYLGESLKTLNAGIFLPFIIAAALKTAQGSSTVSLVTTSALMLPLLPSLGLASEMGKVLTVMAIGAGAMTVSHANDSYFWVVSQFGGMDVKTAYKTQTVATLLQGVVTIIAVFIASLILL
ncbi:GntP family permease [Fonticella tunisiensis]|uniref:Putative D-glycerate permease n=1 Tax=Fonticella tunisiensis TaxID=1096341 RepID=A0A4R7K7K4_9CLOT|nr:GntP family permease [Fonticella tunisiensis]TDT45757.1 putative D-glycerate permease [Fonticella tunisiensis]